MTGFGKTECTTNQKRITIEIRTLNSKNLDLNVRISGSFKEKELEIRKLLSALLKRGKVSFVLNIENTGEEYINIINKNIIALWTSSFSTIVVLIISDSWIKLYNLKFYRLYVLQAVCAPFPFCCFRIL